MKLIGACVYCGKPATDSCILCGALVCKQHIESKRICTRCAAGKVMKC